MNKGRKAAQFPWVLVSLALHHGSLFITNEHTPSPSHFPTSPLSQYSLLHFTFPSLWLDKVPALQLFQAMRVLRVKPNDIAGGENQQECSLINAGLTSKGAKVSSRVKSRWFEADWGPSRAQQTMRCPWADPSQYRLSPPNIFHCL